MSWRLISLLLASMAILLAMSGLATWNLRAQRIEGEWVAHSNQVRYELQRILELLIDAQAGARGFAYTGSERSLQAYSAASPLIDPSVGRLEQLVADSPRARSWAAQLAGMARDLEAADTALVNGARRVSEAQGTDSTARIRPAADEAGVDAVMEAARNLVSQMQADEDRLLVERRLTRDRARRDAAMALWGTGGLGAILLILIVYFTRRDEAKLRLAEREFAATLQQHDAELQIINDYARFPVARCDPLRRYLFVNKAYADRLGKKPQDCVGRHIREIAGDQAYESIEAHIDAALAGRVVEFETEIPYAGSLGPRWMRCIYAPVRDADGTVGSFVAAVTDITDRKTAEAELQRSQAALQETARRKDVFIATLSHELRNPLAPIRAAAKVIASPQVTPPQLQRAQIIIERQVTHMALLLDDLLDIARITQGKLTLRRVEVTLADVIDAAVEATRPQLDAKHHRLSLKLPDAPVLLDADPLRLSQILSNLLLNAAKYSDPGGCIEVQGSTQGETLSLSVRDDGIGIAAQSIGGIFEMFAQIEAVTGRADGGLGIGLALVKGLTELHGGTVEARSGGLGHGSEFIVHLPLAARRPAAPSRATDPAPPRPVRRRILVADDNQDAAESLSMLLELAGHDVRVAHLGRAALSLAQTFRPDTALLDIGMPDMTGYEVARALRQEPWAGDMQLIALTGWGQDDDRRRALTAGFDHHLTKPIDPDHLAGLIAGCPGGHVRPAAHRPHPSNQE